MAAVKVKGIEMFSRYFLRAILVLGFGIGLMGSGCGAAGIEFTDVFVNGENDVHAYRIPSLVVAGNGDLLAFAEARRESRADASPTTIVMKRSTDMGKTWGKMETVVANGRDAFVNPCPIVDEKRGMIWFFYNHLPEKSNEHNSKPGLHLETTTVWMTYSKDNGKSWNEPVNITSMVKKPDWASYAVGPGVGIVTRNGDIVVPFNHGPRPYHSSVFYSKDGGLSWHLGSDVAPDTNECQVVELSDGRIMLNMRSYRGNKKIKKRAVVTSSDLGKNWSKLIDDPTLIEPICQASFLRYTDPRDGLKSRILFSNPASKVARINLTARLSYDEAKSWPVTKTIDSGVVAYSCLAVLPDKTIGCLYEDGEDIDEKKMKERRAWYGALKKITFARFDLGWLTDGKDSL